MKFFLVAIIFIAGQAATADEVKLPCLYNNGDFVTECGDLILGKQPKHLIGNHILYRTHKANERTNRWYIAFYSFYSFRH